MAKENLQEKVLTLARKIPKGKVSTYKILASALGDKNLARFVGNALNRNTHLVKTPCHRLVRSDGKIGGYVKGGKEKKKLLESEGIIIASGRVKDFKRHTFRFK